MLADSESFVRVPVLHDRTDQPRDTSEASLRAALMATDPHKLRLPGREPSQFPNEIPDDLAPRPRADGIDPDRGREDG